MDSTTPQYCQRWFSFLELLESASGIKLRINIADTIIIKDGRILGWFFTSRDGVVTRASNHTISGQTVFQKLAGNQASCNANLNPFNYLALAHFEGGTSRPLTQQELQHLLKNLSGPYDIGCQWPEELNERPFCIQAYVPPLRDLRYIASIGGSDGLQACNIFARRFSLRYTHAFDANPPVAPQLSNVRAPCTLVSTVTHEPPPLSAEEMLVESQLVALGLLEPRLKSTSTDGVTDTTQSLESMMAAEASLPTSTATKTEVQRVMQTLVSFIERAHGLRIQGLVAEFLQSAADAVVLLAVHAVQWDSRASRGRLGTFTDRWADFVSGTGPAPAARPTTKRHFAPAMLTSSDSSQSGPRSMSSTPTANDAIVSGRGHPWAQGFVHHTDNLSVFEARPGSAPTVLMHRYRPTARITESIHGKSPSSPKTRSRDGSMEYAMWMPRDTLATDTIAGILALELEVVRDRLQRQMSTSSRTEAALNHMATNSKAAHETLVVQAEDLKAELASLRTRKKHVQADYERLRNERQNLKSAISAARMDLTSAQAAVEQEWQTLSTQVRIAQNKGDDMQGIIRNLRSDNDDLSQQALILQRKVDEGNEVIEAIKTQLVDYRTLVTSLQGQLRRGKNNLNVASAAGSLLQSLGGSMADMGTKLSGSTPEDAPEDMMAIRIARQTAGANRNPSSNQPASAPTRSGRR